MDEDDEFFTLPVPPPAPPGPPGPPGAGIRHERDVLYIRRDRSDREHEDIMLRRVPADVARRFRAAAGGRALTHAQYLAALVELHESVRAKADAGNGELAAELDRLGLQSVTV